VQDFIAAVDDESDYVAAELARIEAQLQPLMEHRQRLEERARALETVKSTYDIASRRDGRAAVKEHRHFLDVAYDVLRDEGQLYYETIVAKLRNLGVTVPGRNPGPNLIAHMSRSPRFKRVGRGIYDINS
jgi:GAF domain-containing protein